MESQTGTGQFYATACSVYGAWSLQREDGACNYGSVIRPCVSNQRGSYQSDDLAKGAGDWWVQPEVARGRIGN